MIALVATYLAGKYEMLGWETFLAFVLDMTIIISIFEWLAK